MAPRATYRLQFHKGFTFDDAAALAPYLARLGVSHLYASPFFKAHPGSTHGYDVVDYGTLNPELGGEAAFGRLAEALKAQGLRLLLDFVPNHMGVGGADNAFWLDLLEWGEEADHAGWFDVEWVNDRTDLRHKVLVPVLGDQYGVVLEQGDLALRFDAAEGTFAVWAHGSHKLPVCPMHYEFILGRGHRVLADLGDSFADLLHWRPQVMRRARDLKAALATAVKAPELAAALAARVAALNGRPGHFASWSGLAALIERQNWKPAHFLVAADDINYRRFFNIATLAGLRMELPAVFDHAHGLVFSLMQDGLLDGLRIDHIDGLYDPLAYLERLRREAPHPDFYLVVEKILGPDEPLHDEWPVEGTTGYDFTNLLTSFFVNPASEAAFSRLYASATGETETFEAIIFASKLQIVDDEMSSELHRLARAATRVAREDPHTADFTLTVLQRALRLLVASFPVYRTYVDGRHDPTAKDRQDIDRAIASAGSIDRAIDPSVFGFLRRLLTGDLADHAEGAYRRADVYRCAMKMQQYCGPVMAKGVEDTAFYRYYRFVALNEVGGSPDRFGIPVAHFHAANRVRAERWPHSMLATSTHDTKRGEDTRARLAALSVMPDAWQQRVAAWSDMLQPGADLPDRNDRYLLFQLLVGTWPVAFTGSDPLDPEMRGHYIERLQAVTTKSMREAKRHSSWTTPDEPYEVAMAALIEAALAGPSSQRFLDDFRPFADEVAARGARNTFAQTVLKLTVPGMPDIYQGAEGWDLTMVDPDNRRPIDYPARQAILDRLGDMPVPELWADWRDGAFKLALTHRILNLRQRDPNLFASGGYHPVPVEGAEGESVCIFVRTTPGSNLLVLAQRFPDDTDLGSLSVAVPDWLNGQTATSVLTGTTMRLAADCAWGRLSEGLPASAWLVAHDG